MGILKARWISSVTILVAILVNNVGAACDRYVCKAAGGVLQNDASGIDCDTGRTCTDAICCRQEIHALASTSPEPTPPPTPRGWREASGNDEDDSGVDATGITSWESEAAWVIITLAVALFASLLGNLVCCCFVLKRWKKSPPPPPPPPPPVEPAHDPKADAELGRLQGVLVAERSRRIKTEAIVQRARGGGGIRPGEFPSARDVDRDVESLAHHALTWSERAAAVGGSHTALLETTRSVLENTFVICEAEVKRCLDGRLRSLSEFLGHGEPVALSDLSGGDSMNLDTQYLLYECLCRNFRGIVPTEPDRMEHLAGRVEQRCLGAADKSLARRITSGDAWASFENLMKKYIAVFIAMALQKPRMDFEDDIGATSTFDPMIHRDWAPDAKTSIGRPCRIVFPAIRQQEGRPKSNAKIGMVALPS